MAGLEPTLYALLRGAPLPDWATPAVRPAGYVQHSPVHGGARPADAGAGHRAAPRSRPTWRRWRRPIPALGCGRTSRPTSARRSPPASTPPGTPRSRAPRRARPSAWPPPGSAPTCSSPTRSSTRAGSRRSPPWPTRPASRSPSTARRRSTPPRSPGCGACVVDVDVGLPRCGCDPADAGRLADLARAKGLEVRGVMGYEGHLMALEDRAAAARAGRRVDGAAGRGPRRRRRRHHLGRRHGHVRHPRDDRRDRGPGRQLRPDGHGVRQARPAVRAGAVRRRHGHRRQARLRRRRRRPQGARHGPRQPVDRRRQRVVLQRRARHVRARAAIARRSATGYA